MDAKAIAEKRAEIVALAVKRILSQPAMLQSINENLGGALEGVLKGEYADFAHLFDESKGEIVGVAGIESVNVLICVNK